MEDACYIKDPKTGKFLGRKPGCTNNTGEVSEKLLQKVNKDKGAIERRVDAAAASGTLQRQDSTAKDKSEGLARAVNSGKMSYAEGLYELSKGSRSSGRYGKAIDLLDRDASYWNGIRSKTGSDEVDTLIGGYAGAPVPGATDFALNLSGGKSGVQEISDQKSGLPSGKTPEQVKAEHDKWREDIKKKAYDYNKDYQKRFADDQYTKVSGNEIVTKATLYGSINQGIPTASGEIFDNHGFTAAMHRIYRGDGKYVYARVTNVDDPSKSVIVKVNDVGPHTPIVTDRYIDKDGKVKEDHVNMKDPTKGLDLSAAAYNTITDDVKKGALNVKVEFLSPAEGRSAYEGQLKDAEKHQEKIKQDVHETLKLHDSNYRKKLKKEK